MIRFTSLLFLLLAIPSIALDHIYLGRLGLGISGLVGSDVPENTSFGFSGSIGAMGATAFYPGGPLWGTELHATSHSVEKDTVLWSDQTGDYTDSTQYGLGYGRATFGLFLMKSWDSGLNLLAGPLFAYQFSCSKVVDGATESCDEEYQPFQLDAQISIMKIFLEVFAVDIRYAQTLLPFDKDAARHELHYVGSFGISYLF